MKTIATLELILNSLERIIKSKSIVSNDWDHRPLVAESPGVIFSNSALWTPSQMQSSEFQRICCLIEFLDILLFETTYIISTFTLKYKHDMEKEMATTPVLLPGESHGQKILAGCSPKGRRVRHDWSTLACTGRALGFSPGAQHFTPVFLPGESPWTEEPGRLQSIGSQRVGLTEAT